MRHSGVVTMFGQHLVRGEGFDPELGRVIRRLFEGRLEVTYRDVGISEERVTAAVADAEGFVSAVDAWLAERS